MSRACIRSTCGMIAAAFVKLTNTLHVASSSAHSHKGHHRQSTALLTAAAVPKQKYQRSSHEVYCLQLQCALLATTLKAVAHAWCGARSSTTASARSTLTDTKRCRQSVAPHATWLQSCSRMGPHTPVQQICGPLGACCMSVLLATLPSSAPPSTTLSMTSSLERLQICQVSCRFLLPQDPCFAGVECMCVGLTSGGTA